MSHFARVENGIVTQVIVIERETLEQGHWGDPAEWIQTSYNTHGGVHVLGSTPLRKNYAGIGFSYDSERDAFIPPKQHDSWILDEETCTWEPPIPWPDPVDGKQIVWNESKMDWDWIDTVPMFGTS